MVLTIIDNKSYSSLRYQSTQLLGRSRSVIIEVDIFSPLIYLY